MKKLLLLAGIIFAFCSFAYKVFSEETNQMVYTQPYLLSLQPDTEMNICWLTRESAKESYIEYGLTEALGTKVPAKEFKIYGLRKSATLAGYNTEPDKNPALDTFQEIATVKALTPGKKYFYRVVTKAGNNVLEGKTYYFKTAPMPGSPVKYALLSDLQQKGETLETVKQIGRQKVDFLIYNGDMQNTPWKAGEWFPVKNCFINKEEAGKEWFTVMQQTAESAELLQYAPIYPCPGNHELDEQRCLTNKDMSEKQDEWKLSIYMQIFRPLYPEQEYGKNGKHWYSVDYGDLHIVSLSVFRWHPWDGFEYPGWRGFDDIDQDSRQVKWLKSDLEQNKRKYTWVTMHWHMLNRGSDGYVPFSAPEKDPVHENKVVYTHGDYCFDVLRPIFEKYSVNGVSFGHSHVYERYLINKVNYIEAASIGNNYRLKSDPYPVSGYKPIVEENRFRSYMILSIDGTGALTAQGIQASETGPGTGSAGKVFDSFKVGE